MNYVNIRSDNGHTQIVHCVLVICICKYGIFRLCKILIGIDSGWVDWSFLISGGIYDHRFWKMTVFLLGTYLYSSTGVKRLKSPA